MFDIAANEPALQIHAASALSSEGLWLTWTGRGDGSSFQIFSAHMRCDGSVDVAPQQRSTTEASQLDSAVAVGADGRALFAWQADVSTTEPQTEFNLSTWVDLHDGDGFAGARQVELPRGGRAHEGQSWMPAVLARKGGGYVLAGSWSHPDTEVFRAYAVPLDESGEPLQDASDLFDDAGDGQTAVQVAEDKDRRLHFVWSQSDLDAENDTIWRAASDPKGVAAVNRAPLGEGSGPSVSAWGDVVWFAWASPDGEIMLESLDGISARVGSGAAGPALAANRDGGVSVAWLEGQGGTANAIRLRRLDALGDTVASASLDTLNAGPYPFNLTRVDDDLVFVAYQDGDSPDFYARGVLVQLTP